MLWTSLLPLFNLQRQNEGITRKGKYMQWNLYKWGVFRIQCSKRLQSVGGKYVALCLEDAKLIRTLQIDGFALAWNTVVYKGALVEL